MEVKKTGVELVVHSNEYDDVQELNERHFCKKIPPGRTWRHELTI
jgi:hypothetical protein